MTAQARFWNWFLQHEPELFNLDSRREPGRERMFDQLHAELRKVDPNLTFELGPPMETKRQFVISAGGIKSAFPAVVSLADAPHNLFRWQVIAFRPRRIPTTIVELQGKRVDPRDVQFTLFDNGRVAGINLFIPGFREGDADFRQIGYLMLDDALGEYDVETRLGLIRMLLPDTRTDGNRYPLPELPALFD